MATGFSRSPRERSTRSAQPLNQIVVEQSPTLDRGHALAWHVAFVCGRCGRGCRILYNPLVSWRNLGLAEEHIEKSWGCQTCGKYKWPSQRWTGTSSRTGRRPASHTYQRHQHAADRCTQLLEEPRWLTWDRCIALERLKNAHWLLATAAACHSWPGISSGISAEQIEQAHRTIERDGWATRQRSWARQGMPRPGPKARAMKRVL